MYNLRGIRRCRVVSIVSWRIFCPYLWSFRSISLTCVFGWVWVESVVMYRWVTLAGGYAIDRWLRTKLSRSSTSNFHEFLFYFYSKTYYDHIVPWTWVPPWRRYEIVRILLDVPSEIREDQSPHRDHDSIPDRYVRESETPVCSSVGVRVVFCDDRA